MRPEQYLLAGLVRGVARRPLWTLLVLALVTAMALLYSVSNFSINSDIGDLIRQERDWRTDYNTYKERFPVHYENALVVVSGDSLGAVERVTDRLARAMRAEETFDNVFAPLADPFLREHGLLMLEEQDLDELADRLASAQPVLTAIVETPGLSGILAVLRRGVVEGGDSDSELEELMQPLVESAESVAVGESGRIDWRDQLLEPDDESAHYGVIALRGQVFTELARPDSVIMARLREIIAGTPTEPGVRVRITGHVALSHEEIVAAQEGVQVAGIVSLVLLAAILAIGVRSAKIIGATVLLLTVGVVWTSAWGLWAVGHFNPLSVIFAVIFFGLGVDFAVHYSLRYQEALCYGRNNTDALVEAATSVGPSILLCTLTTMVGFLAFVPTDYQGLSELGIIAAGGMAVAAVLVFALLPALYSLTGAPRPVSPEINRGVEVVHALLARRRPVLLGTAALAGIALLLAPQLRFDYSVLALRNPAAESMTTLRELQREGQVNLYAISVLTDDAARIPALREQLEALPEVHSVQSPLDYAPADQSERLAILRDIRFMLASALDPAAGTSATDADLAAAVADLRAAIATEEISDPDTRALVRRFDDALAELQARGSGALEEWERAATAGLAKEVEWLRRALNAGPIRFGELPRELRIRLRSDSGHYRLAVLPAEDIGSIETLSEFVEAVRSVVPDATGRPVVEWGLGEVVGKAFVQALSLAFVAVALILWIVLRSVADTLLVLAPLLLAALFTVALQVLVDVPLNMANILVLPLIFGLGVDNGIHVVHRFRRDGSVDALLHSSTPRAVVISTLTTIGTFAALSLSPHRGTASVGLLLCFAVSFLLLFVLVLLPLLLAGREPGAAGLRSAAAR